MSLQDTKNDCRAYAARLEKKFEQYSAEKQYEHYDINDLADGYCEAVEHNNEENKNIYISALLLRFWYAIDKMYQKVKQCGYDREDIFYRLYKCIDDACAYKAWRDPEKHTNAQACINQVISTRGVPALIYEAGLQKNTQLLTVLDDPISDDGATTFGDMLEDEEEFYDSSKNIIQGLIRKGNIVEAIIADTIAHNDCFKHNSKTIKEEKEDGDPYRYTEHYSEFWPYKVVQKLNEIDANYVKNFINTYTIDDNKAAIAFKRLIDANNQKKYKMITSTLNTTKNLINA